MSRVLDVLKVSHLDTEKVFTISPRATVYEVGKILQDKGFGALPVLDEGKMVGIITERDLAFKVLLDRVDPKKVFVAEYMTADPAYVSPFTNIMDCLNLMKDKKIRHVPVLEKGKLVGLVSMRDILYALLRNQELVAQQFESYILGAR